jgi:two-component system cell cycle response regulator
LATLLLIDDSLSHRALISDVVSRSRTFDRVLEAEDGLSGLRQLLNEEVDVVLCDLEMPGFDGEKILHVKQASPSCRDTPIIFVTGSSNLDRMARLLEIGANDVIAKPFHGPDVLARLKLQLRTKRLHDELRLKTETMARLSTTDAVTGLRTRRYASEALSIEFLRSRRYETPFSVMMADLDHFKRVNDEYGHLAGDVVLQGVSQLLLDQIRVTDVAGRFGGEEIMVILAQNDVHGALFLAERWRASIEQTEFESMDGRKIKTQISIGVAGWDASMESPDELIARADSMLYKAKANGRNQVVIDE